MSYPIVELAFWEPGDPGSPAVDALLLDPCAPLARHGLTGIAGEYAAQTGAEIDDVQRWWCNELSLKSMAVDGAMAHVVPALTMAEVRFFVAKGPALAYLEYRLPSLRPYTDLDVYVAREHHDRALHVLTELGFESVPHAPGPLRGQGRELHGGAFGAVVELHAEVVDNLHARRLPPIAAYLEHVTTRDLAGTAVPVLTASASLALQAIHAGAGHRYAKLGLLRDLRRGHLNGADEDTLEALGAEPYLSCALGIANRLMSRQTGERPRGVLGSRVVEAFSTVDPGRWDEHSISPANVLALLNQPTVAQGLHAGLVAARRARHGRRAPLHLSGIGQPVSS